MTRPSIVGVAVAVAVATAAARIAMLNATDVGSRMLFHVHNVASWRRICCVSRWIVAIIRQHATLTIEHKPSTMPRAFGPFAIADFV